MSLRLVILLMLMICGCAVGPDYQRPDYPVPDKFRGQGPDISRQPAEASFGDLRWFEVFKDDQLQELIRVADFAAWFHPQRASHGADRGLIFGDLSWELDFFGRIRRATEAAQAEFFASEENRNFVIQTLVTDLARAYIELRALDQQLDISERTVKVREESLKLVKARFDYGWVSLTPVLMTENLVYGDRSVVPDLKRAIEQKENQISALLGRNPGPITRGKSLLEQDLTVSIPPGLTSALLERRPDIRFAEEQLVAANARVGEAKALLFPNIRITGVSGWESAALKNLFTGPASFWDIVSPGIIQPIFQGGRPGFPLWTHEGLGNPCTALLPQ